MPKKHKVIHPNILVLEGLWADTSDLIHAAGGHATEESPWDWVGVETEMMSSNYDGLLLTGGSDINPNLYGEDPCHEVYGIDDLRDSVELRALELAEKMGMPVLGICRGSQIMAAYKGGKLVQHIGENHRGSGHEVFAVESARTFKRACSSKQMEVVSLHHQCVERPGKGMRIAAYASDGTVEAIESKDGRWLGVQFHPEINALENGNSWSIIRWLVEEAARYAGGRAPRRPFRIAQWGTYMPARVTYTPGNKQNTVQPSQATTSATVRVPRKAGDPAVPSMREVVALIEESTGDTVMILESTAVLEKTEPLQVCPTCGLMFDEERDRDDHLLYVHGRIEDNHILTPFYAAEERYPELEPPPGHQAWEDDVLTQHGFIPGYAEDKIH